MLNWNESLRGNFISLSKRSSLKGKGFGINQKYKRLVFWYCLQLGERFVQFLRQKGKCLETTLRGVHTDGEVVHSLQRNKNENVVK